MTFNCYTSEFSRNFAGIRRLGRQQQLMKIDLYCQRQRCDPLNVLFNITRMFLALICRRPKLLSQGPSYKHCCRAFTLGLARLSCHLYIYMYVDVRESATILLYFTFSVVPNVTVSIVITCISQFISAEQTQVPIYYFRWTTVVTMTTDMLF